MSALITRRPGTEWMSQTRRWTLTGWGFLSAAIIAGGWWSYEVLGWGGYWAWDPVENVSFLPWLTATAFIHSCAGAGAPPDAQGVEHLPHHPDFFPVDFGHLLDALGRPLVGSRLW